MKRNVMIISQTLSVGGAEKLAANLSLGLKDIANVYVVTYLETDKEYDYAGHRINLNLIGNSKLSKMINAIKRVIIIKRLKKTYQIDCSVSYVPPCDYVNVLSRTKKEKVFIDVVSNMSTAFPKGIRRIFRKYVLSKADFIVTVSEGVRQDIIDHFGVSEDKSRTIYNSCDIHAIEDECKNGEIIEKERLDLPGKYISTMGSFRLPKGHWHLIKAFSTIVSEIPEYKLVICGDGVYREKYVELINKLGIQDKVVMTGFLNPPHSVISKSALFVFSSVFEGFGNAVIEAMACGVPVVSTDCKYGPREILAPDTPFTTQSDGLEWAKYGLLVPAFPVDDIDTSTNISSEERLLGTAIKEMLNCPEKKEEYVTLGKEYCHMFDNEHITAIWLDTIEEVLNG